MPTLSALDPTPPAPPATPEFDGWIEDNADYILRHCPLERASTYYFDFTGGNDASDGLTPATAFKTLTKARAVFAAAPASAGVRFRFKRGEVWRDTTGLNFAGKLVTVDSYGSAGAQPRLTAFALQWTTGWTLVSGTTYKRTVGSGGAVAWVAYTNDRFNFLMRAGSTTLAAGQWFWNAGTSEVYVNIGSDPNATPLEAVQANSQHGVNIDADGSRVHDVECNGFGMDPAASNNQFYAFSSRAKDSAVVAFTYCTGHYTSAHSIAHYIDSFTGGSGQGGVTLFKNCRAGGALYSVAGSTIYNEYASNGGNVMFLLESDVTWGMLPSADWTNGSNVVRHGQAAYGHTGGAPYLISLFVVRNLNVVANKWGAAGNAFCGGIVAPTDPDDLSTYRAFIVGERFERGDTANRAGAGNLFFVGASGHVFVDCFYDLTPVQPPVAPGVIDIQAIGITVPDTTSVWLGGFLRVDFGLTTSANFGVNNAGTAWGGRMIGTEIRMVPRAGQTVSLDYAGSFAGGTYAVNLYLAGCLLANEGPGAFYIGTLNDGAHQLANAYWRVAPDGTYQGIGNDAQRVELSREPQYRVRRMTDPWGPLFAAGPVALPGGLPLRERDPDGWSLDGQHNIGPFAYRGGGSAAPPVTPSASPATTAAYATTRNGQGAVAGGVAVDFRLKDPLASGTGVDVWNRQAFRATSDAATGLLTVTLVKGATYAARWASPPATAAQPYVEFTVPADAGATWPLPEIVGPF